MIDTMTRFRVTIAQLSRAIDRTPATIINWWEGKHAPPVYMPMTVEAIARKLVPVSHDKMYGYQLTDVIGIPYETEWHWRYRQHFPTAARYAVALVDWRADTVTPHELKILRNVYRAGKYYRVTGGWRARAVMGRALPTMRKDTPASLIHRGFLTTRDGALTLTERGKNEAL